jgi:hypothetical protein
LSVPDTQTCSATYAALLFQPRVIAVAALAGSAFQSALIFAVLAAILFGSAALPRLNPFDAFYNAYLSPRSSVRLSAAPAPRRFAQLVAASMSAAIAGLLALDMNVASMAVQGVLLAAIGALVFGGFCAGSYVFHILGGRRAFANETAPWARTA